MTWESAWVSSATCDVEAAWGDDFKPSETVTFHKESGFLLRLLADYYILPFVGVAFSFNYSSIMFPNDIQYYDNGKYNRIKKDEVHMFELNGGLRFQYALTERLSIKPGFSLGYGFTTATTAYARETGFKMNADVQLEYRLSKMGVSSSTEIERDAPLYRIVIFAKDMTDNASDIHIPILFPNGYFFL